MKIKLLLTFILSFIFGLLSSRIPQGFNYQAVARLTKGDPIINTTLPVRITIQADSLGTSIIWQELHSSVTTNGFGLMTLVLGKGARQASSTVATFSAIDTPASPPDAGWNMNDRLFVVGNGISDVARSNALTVLKNGCVGLPSVTSPTYALQLPNNSNIAEGSGRAYAWTTYSDNRLKENQVCLEYGLNEIMKLLPKQYIHHSSVDQSTWPMDNAPKSIGFLAQDVYNVIPEAVNVPENNASELWGLDYNKFIPVVD